MKKSKLIITAIIVSMSLTTGTVTAGPKTTKPPAPKVVSLDLSTRIADLLSF